MRASFNQATRIIQCTITELDLEKYEMTLMCPQTVRGEYRVAVPLLNAGNAFGLTVVPSKGQIITAVYDGANVLPLPIMPMEIDGSYRAMRPLNAQPGDLYAISLRSGIILKEKYAQIFVVDENNIPRYVTLLSKQNDEQETIELEAEIDYFTLKAKNCYISWNKHGEEEKLNAEIGDWKLVVTAEGIQITHSSGAKYLIGSEQFSADTGKDKFELNDGFKYEGANGSISLINGELKISAERLVLDISDEVSINAGTLKVNANNISTDAQSYELNSSQYNLDSSSAKLSSANMSLDVANAKINGVISGSGTVTYSGNVNVNGLLMRNEISVIDEVQFTTFKTALNSLLQTMASQYSAHTHAVAAIGAGATAPPIPTMIVAPLP